MTDSDSESADPVVVKKKESFWKRNLLRLSSNRSSLHQLIPRAELGDVNPGPIPENLSDTQSDVICHNHEKNKIRRPRSAGDITETLYGCASTAHASVTGVSTFPGGANGQGPEGINVVSSNAFSRPSTIPISTGNGTGSTSHQRDSGTTPVESNNNSESSPSNGSGSSNNTGGILSFFGVKFKSNTRHLERSGCQHNLDCGVVFPGKPCSQNHTGAPSTANTGASSNHSNNNNKQNGDLRYTKFPLAYGKTPNIISPTSGVVGTGGQSGDASSSKNKLNYASSSSSSSSSASASSSIKSSLNRHKSKLCRSLDSSQHQQQLDAGSDASSTSTSGNNPTDSSSSGVASTIPPNLPFEESQIHFTPQTKTYAHPHRSPVPPSKGYNGTSSSSSTGNFLTNTVSSFGRKVVNSVTPGSRSKHNKSKLKAKSKSDNSLHRVNCNNVNVNSVLAAACNSSNGGVVPRNASASTFTSYLDNQLQQSSSYSLESSESSSERRLNSVQLGDHATIRLPWTGFQQNNLSSVSSTRANIPNTHNNNFDLSSLSSTSIPTASSLVNSSNVRYVECGGNSHLRSLAVHPPLHTSLNSGPRLVNNSSIAGTSRVIVTRRRSRSLERCSNFRVIPITSSGASSCNSGATFSQSNSNASHSVSPWRNEFGDPTLNRSHSRKESGSEREKQRTRSAHSLERSTTHKVRQLTPTEHEILLRNVDWNAHHHNQPQPPRRPDKPLKSSNIFPGNATSSSSTSTLASGKSGRKEPQRYPFEKLHRSAPNSSFSNSSESGESSYSAPPSPPPRPASTLKPDSRLIIHHPTSSSSSSVRNNSQTHHQPLPQKGSFSPGASSANTTMLNSIPKRRAVPPRSHGSSSDSGVSHISGSTSTVRGTSDFSDESAGSVNISQHSFSQQSSTMSHQTTMTSSSGGGLHHSTTASTSSSSVNTAGATTNPAGISLEDVRNSGFINKPLKGWLHSDQMLSKEGVVYTVRYIGCLDVNTSMKSLDFDTRSLIAKECINQVCEAAGLRSMDKKRKVDRRVARILGMRPRLDHAGSDVRLTITSTCLKLTSLDTGAVIAVHDMPNISFASGGDATMLDFVAYVAKDSIVGRACFVLECGSGLAQDVITTVGQAFELRFKEYLQKRPPPPRIPIDDPDPEYYNDLPGKVPPDIPTASADSKDKIQNVKGKSSSSTRAKEPPPLNLHSSNDKELSVNLIDFEAPTPPAFGPSVEDKQLDSFLLPSSDQSCGANNLGASGGQSNSVVGTGLGLPNSPSQPQPKDPFDMQPFSSTLPQSIPASVVEEQRRLLEGEIWFHGTVSRGEAEELMKHDGDFLVRESMACPGQFVLTGLQGGSSKHLLLVDPEGIVRTKDRTFDNVIHLVKYHSENCLPIISAESMVILRSPVPRVIS